MLGFIALSEAALSDIEVAEQLVQVTQDVTGVSSSVAVGSVSTGIGPNLGLSSVAASGSAGTLSVIHDAAITITGTAASATAGTTSLIYDASVTQTGVSTAGSVGTLDVTLSAATTLTGVTSSLAFGTAADAFDADANITLSSATATSFVSDITEIKLTASLVLPEVVSTITEAALEFSANANTNLTSATASLALDQIDPKGDASIVLGDVNTSTQTTAPTITLSAAAEISGVSSTIAFGTAADAFDADANIVINSVIANVVANAFEDVKAKAIIEIGSISSNVIAEDLGLSLDANLRISSVIADIFNSNVVTNAVQFEYDPNDYDKSRVVYLNGQYENNVVFIEPELKTVYTTKVTTFNTVIIEPENRTVVVDKIPVNSKTVYIAA